MVAEPIVPDPPAASNSINWALPLPIIAKASFAEHSLFSLFLLLATRLVRVVFVAHHATCLLPVGRRPRLDLKLRLLLGRVTPCCSCPPSKMGRRRNMYALPATGNQSDEYRKPRSEDTLEIAKCRAGSTSFGL